jgi:hypothetical protein
MTSLPPVLVHALPNRADDSLAGDGGRERPWRAFPVAAGASSGNIVGELSNVGSRRSNCRPVALTVPCAARR